MSSKFVLGFPLVMALPAGALAQSEPASAWTDFYNLSLEELAKIEVSIATGNSTPFDRAPATASVIYAAEIEAMGAQQLNDVLETVPGLHVSKSALSRLDSVYSIRGIHTGFNPQVLLLLNGVPVKYSLQGSRPTLFRLPASNIERVEVIRGPGSAVYGADAYSGVINVITKDATTVSGSRVSARSGSFGERELSAQTAKQWQDWAVAFSVSYQESNGDSERRINSDFQSVLDGVLNTDASRAPGALSTRYQLVDTHLSIQHDRLQANIWNWHSTDAGVGAGAAQALDPEGRDDSDLWMADATYKIDVGSEHWDNHVRLSYMHYDQSAQFVIFPEGALLPIGEDGNVNSTAIAGIVEFPDGLIGNPGSVTEDAQLDVISIYEGWESHRVRVAVGSRHQSLDPRERKNFGPGVIDGSEAVVDGTLTDVTGTDYVFMENASRRVNYVSVQDEWRALTDLSITAGLRYDDYSDFGSTTNPRAALVWAANEKLTTKLLYGSAFRAPSFAELYFKHNPVSLGNTKLKPERIDTQELSFTYRATQHVQATLTAFVYEATDMVEFIPGDGDDASLTSAHNARDQNGRGGELEVHWKPSTRLHLSGSYSLQDAEDARTKVDIADAPGQQFKLNANWEWAHNWSINGQVYWVADRERALGDPRADIDDYTLLHLTLHRKNLFPGVDLSLAVRNAANADAREPSSVAIPDDYPLESRRVWLGLAYKF